MQLSVQGRPARQRERLYSLDRAVSFVRNPQAHASTPARSSKDNRDSIVAGGTACTRAVVLALPNRIAISAP
eukprot:247503-Prorocentrum_minimum.AAC.1